MSRADFIERAPREQAVSAHYIGATLAPHAETERLSYTVPIGKRTMLQACSATVRNRTGSAGSGFLYARITRNGAMICTAENTDPIIYAVKSRVNGAAQLLLEGETIKGYTADTFGSGTVNARIAFYAREFTL